ncbi:MAG: response regulator [Opitutus sp.]
MNSLLKILVVDDGDLKRILLAHHLLLRFPSARITQCDSGAAAIELIKVNPFDAVVTDNNMSPVTGIELILWIRSNVGHMPIVMISGNPHIEEAALKAGADAVLNSLQFKKLGATLAKLLGETGPGDL